MTHQQFDKYYWRVILEKMLNSGVLHLSLPDPGNSKHLKGVAIHLSAAAEKYNINKYTISRWVNSGYIKVLGWDKNRKLLNEQDVALLANLYNTNPGQGSQIIKKFFDNN